MPISRRLPKSDEQRKLALNTAKIKKDNTPPANIVLTTNTVTRLDAMQPVFSAAMQTRATALQAQGNVTTLKNQAQAEAKLFISHFIQTFNNSVERGVFPASDRAYYQLDMSSNSVPPLDTEALVLLWGQNIIDGDAIRTAAGGTPLAFPTIAEVSGRYTAFITANSAQSTAKDAYEQAQLAVSDMHTAVDDLILRIWDEVETAFNDEPISAKRRNAREWGVVYVDSSAPPTVTNIIAVSNQNPLQPIIMDFFAKTAAGCTLVFTYDDGNTDTVFNAGNGVPTTVTHIFLTAVNHTTTIGGELIEVGEIDLNDNKLISLLLPDAMSPRHIAVKDNQLITLSIPATYTGLLIFEGTNNAFDVNTVNGILTLINSFGTNGGSLLLDGGTNAAPTGQGIAAKNQLTARGWTVVTN